MKKQDSEADIREFFAWSELLDHFVTRPLSHIAPNWELTWDHSGQCYMPEPDSLASDVNKVIEIISKLPRPQNYHDHEDEVARRLIGTSGWPIQKKMGRWIGADYRSILENGGFEDYGQLELLASAAGRTHAALDFGQKHFDAMEEGHLNMLAAVLTIILYHRTCDGTILMAPDDE
ncbi:hypothetical protein L2D00_03885 [Hyphomonadaceae bacterium BL14]|nr:hypothetical protein L2D00_03885 [Hyphomonadaceae bacterium BL14]